MAALVIFPLLVIGCTSPGPPTATRRRVVVSTPILGDIVQQAVKDQVDVEILTPRGIDPRSYLLTEKQRAMVATSSLIVVVGFGADPDLGDLLTRATRQGGVVVEAAPRLNPRPLGAGIDAGAAPASLPPDPNVWLDPDRITQLARIVADQVTKLPGIDRDAIARQTQGYADQLARTDEAIQASLLPVPDTKRALVTQHDVLGYFAERYALKVVAVAQPDPDRAPSSTDLDGIAAKMRAASIRVVLADRQPAASFMQELADRVPGAEVIVIDVTTLGPPGSNTDSAATILSTLAGLGPPMAR